MSHVYSTTTVDDDKKLYELTVRMKLLANETLNAFNDDLIQKSTELADTVLEFIKVAGWSR